MKEIKMILCDLDGTLLKDDKTISPYTLEIIAKARKKGILFGLATGRSLTAVDPLMAKWGITDEVDVLLGFNGAQIHDKTLQIEELNHLMKGSAILEIISHFEDMPVNCCVYVGRDLYAIKHDHLSENLAKGNLFQEKVIENREEFFKKDYPKLVIMCDPEVMPAVEARAATFSSPEYHCFRTAATLFEYVSPEVSKTAAIQRICDLHGFSIDDVCVFGDAANDRDMIQNAGWGVCMINGDDVTKSLSDDISRFSNNEDGVAEYIARCFL